MLILKNIEKNNDIIRAEYDPEKSGCIGSIAIDINSRNVIESKITSYDENIPIYLNHAIAALEKMISLDVVPEEKVVMWY